MCLTGPAQSPSGNIVLSYSRKFDNTTYKVCCIIIVVDKFKYSYPVCEPLWAHWRWRAYPMVTTVPPWFPPNWAQRTLMQHWSTWRLRSTLLRGLRWMSLSKLCLNHCRSPMTLLVAHAWVNCTLRLHCTCMFISCNIHVYTLEELILHNYMHVSGVSSTMLCTCSLPVFWLQVLPHLQATVDGLIEMFKPPNQLHFQE